jgi:hypothetical protein
MTLGTHAITRGDGLSWSAFGFAMGQEILLDGTPAGTIANIGDTTNSTLTITGPAFTPGSGAHVLAVFGPAVVNTSGFTFGAGTIVRTDLRSWGEFGFATGMPITIDGVVVGTATSINGYTMSVSALGSWTAGQHTVAIFDTTAGSPVLMGGDNIGISGGGGPGRIVSPTVAGGHFSATATTLTRTDGGSWVTDGFAVGRILQIGPNPSWTITAVTATTLTVSGPAIVPASIAGMAVQSLTPSLGAGRFSVSGLTLSRTDGGSWIADGFVYGQVLQIGPSPAWKVTAVTATTLTVSGPTIGDTTGMSLQGFAPSPLVVYGDTSQDGIWYSGDPHTMTQRDFGPKAFPTTIGNGTPDYIFPVADPFRYAGNDVIDASAMFAAVPNGQVPSVGVTIYGGAGNDTIKGSQANDFIAGGSGNNTIWGERGQNQLLGSDGTNVNIISRAVSFPTVNASVYQDADHLQAGNNLIYGDVPGSVATDRFGDYNDVIFGAMGVVTQDTAESTVGTVTGTQRAVPGVTITSQSNGRATLTCSSACFQLNDVGLDVSDGNVNITIGTYIYGFTDSMHATLSTNPVADETATLTLGPLHGYFRPTGTNRFGETTPEKIQTTLDILSASSTTPQNHGNNTMYGNGGDNVEVGGDGNNNIQGGPGRNLIIAGSVLLDRTTHLFNYTNPRFQNLSGTQAYNTTPSNTSAFGQAMNDGFAQCDPTGHAWWADFLSNGPAGTYSSPSCAQGSGATGITLSAPLGTASWPVFLQDSSYKGADYIAGGSGSSYIFGESNDNIIQAHGSIDIAYPTVGGSSIANQGASNFETVGNPYAGAAACMFAGNLLGDRVGACRTFAGDPLPVDPTQTLRINPSIDNNGPNYSATGSWVFGGSAGGNTVKGSDGL